MKFFVESESRKGNVEIDDDSTIDKALDAVCLLLEMATYHKETINDAILERAADIEEDANGQTS